MDIAMGTEAKIMSAPVKVQRCNRGEGWVVMVAIPGGGSGGLVGFTLTDIFHESDDGCASSIPTTTKPHAGAQEEGHTVNLVIMKNMD
eukprot:8813748-Lingulodinium_polyedra.AAC.1